MGLMLSSLLACSGGAALLACVYPNWAADRAALTQAVHFVAFGLVALGAGILAGQMSCFLTFTNNHMHFDNCKPPTC